MRELHNAVARRLALGELASAESAWRAPPSKTPTSIAPPGQERASDVVERVLELDLPLSQSRELVVDEFERRYVQRVLARHNGDVARAAAASGIARRYFQLLRARQAKADKA